MTNNQERALNFMKYLKTNGVVEDDIYLVLRRMLDEAKYRGYL